MDHREWHVERNRTLTISTGWIMDVAIIPAAPPLMKGRAAAMAGCLRISLRGRAAERVGADADMVSAEVGVWIGVRSFGRGRRSVVREVEECIKLKREEE
jgi:VanZ family protein